MASSHVFLSPGFFGFHTLGSYEYFCHVETAIRQRFEAAQRPVDVHVVNVHPTASIRRRAAKLLHTIETFAEDGGAIHLLGHSTGGLDARLIASPSMNLHGVALPPQWAGRIRSVTCINTPHYGTPLASFFATLSGQRLLYALSALTILVLKLGAPPLALSSSFVAALTGIERSVGLQLRVIDRLTDQVVRLMDNASSDEVSSFLKLLRGDQGAIIQLSPESMDLFQAGVEDSADIYYQCTASYTPAPGVIHWAKSLLTPWSSFSLPIFATLHRLTSRENDIYPCCAPGVQSDRDLRDALGFVPPPAANDGVVPIRSQLWGKLVWAGVGDHLDVVGHFDGGDEYPTHVDWLGSGSAFNKERFEAMMEAIVQGMLQAES